MFDLLGASSSHLPIVLLHTLYNSCSKAAAQFPCNSLIVALPEHGFSSSLHPNLLGNRIHALLNQPKCACTFEAFEDGAHITLNLRIVL